MRSTRDLGVVALLPVVIGVLPFATGCRACGGGEDEAPSAPSASGPAMPPGMLGPPSAAASAETDLAARARFVSAHDAGAWVAFAPASDPNAPPRDAPGTRWLSPDAMMLLHDAFVRAKPGFDPFRPHHLDAAELVALEKELAAFASTWSAATTASAARARYGGSDLVRSASDDDAWKKLQGALLVTIDELRRTCTELAGQGRGLWVGG